MHLIYSAMAALFAIFSATSLSAQSIEGFRLGDDKGVLQRLGTAAAAKSDSAFTTLTFHLNNRVDLDVTYQKPSNRLVALLASWHGTGDGPSASYDGFTFGKTSLADLRSKMGASGILYGSTPPVVASSSGTIKIVSYYDVSATDYVASFVTSISRDEAKRLKEQYNQYAYRNAGTSAKLSAIGISRREYLEKSQGSDRTLDIGYKPISWTSSDLALVTLRSISLAKIKQSQLPVFRIYSGPNNFPDFSGRDKEFSNFRTRITNGMTDGPSFAGEYSVIQIGCGTGCSFAYIGNNRTGEVHELPVGGEGNMYLTLKYQLDSRLLVAQWGDYDASKCYIQFFSFDDGAWTDLLKHEVGPMDNCYKTIAENVH
ncbi:hypothetical protein CWR43_14205 [Rhizobium sullae]|uniref:Uncharacterized protein n=1 Tax=Rhizobium sullae TaxID=50338 RepID=A0A2N0DAS8_RHISU|nr:hypothetical protein [Rhizobium sullae]PKA43196.1 hypothetical protein CWR43_14205 [Rhizobium sullae]